MSQITDRADFRLWHADMLDRLVLAGLMLVMGLLCVLFTTTTENSNLIKTLIFETSSVLLVGLWLVGHIGLGTQHVRRSPLLSPVLAWVAVAVVGAVLVDPRFRYAAAARAGRVAACAGAFILAGACTRTARDMRAWLVLLCVVSVGTGAYGYMQHFGVDPVGWNSQPRILSTFGNPNFYGGFLVLALPIVSGSALSVKGKPLYVVLTAIGGGLVAALVWTGSRGAWLGGAVSVVVVLAAMLLHRRVRFAATRRRLRLCVLALAVVCSAVLAFAHASDAVARRARGITANPDLSARLRPVLWRAAGRMLLERPVLGWGPGMFEVYFPLFRPPDYESYGIAPITLHAHSEYAQIAAEQGAVGLGVWVWLMAGLAMSARSALRRDDAGATPAFAVVGVLAGCVGLLAHAGVSVNLRWTVCAAPLWVAMGCLTAMASPAEPRSLRPAGRLRGRTVAACATILALVMASAVTWAGRVFVADRQLDLGKALNKLGLYDRSIWALEEATRYHPWLTKAWYQLGHAYAMTGDADRALGAYQRTAGLSPDFARVHYNLGRLYLEKGDFARAADELSRQAELQDSSVVLVLLAQAEAALHDIPSAETHLRKAVELAPDDALPRIRLARLLVSSGRVEEGLAYLSRVFDESAPQPAVAFALGDLNHQLKRYDESIRWYKTALELSPDDNEIANNLGVAYLDAGRPERAAEAFERALTINDKDVLAHLNLGRSYERLGRLPEAMAEYRLVTVLAGGTPQARDAGARLARVCSTLGQR